MRQGAIKLNVERNIIDAVLNSNLSYNLTEPPAENKSPQEAVSPVYYPAQYSYLLFLLDKGTI